MSLLDTDDDTLRDRMERSPGLLLPEVRGLQGQVAAIRALADDLVARGEGDRGLSAGVRRDVAADIVAALDDVDRGTT